MCSTYLVLPFPLLLPLALARCDLLQERLWFWHCSAAPKLYAT